MESFICEECKKSFKNRKALTAHSMVHINENLSCEYCNRVFRNARALGCHIAASHKKQNPQVCEYCQREFKTLRALKTHEAEMHSINHGSFKCEQCDSIFNTKRALSVHASMKHNVEINSKLRIQTKEIANRESVKAKIQETRMKNFNKPEYVAKRKAAGLKGANTRKERYDWSALMSEVGNRPETKLKRSKAMKKVWQDPNSKERDHDMRSKASKKAWANKTDEKKYEDLQKFRGGAKCEVEAFGKTIDCDSSYEKRFIELAMKDKHIKDLERCKSFIPIIGLGRRYNPDFFVVRQDGSKEIVEIKSSYTIKKEDTPFKVEAAIAWCEDNNYAYRLLTEKELDKYEQTNWY